MSVESVTQAVSNLALQFGDDDAESGAMVSRGILDIWTVFVQAPTSPTHLTKSLTIFSRDDHVQLWDPQSCV